MNQAEVSKLISQLKIAVNPRPRLLRNSEGPEGRLKKLRKTVTALIKYERLELHYNRADEARGYAERVSSSAVQFCFLWIINCNITSNFFFFQLISEAIRNGDRHKKTMEMADYWLLEKQLVHKLFKVIVPRFENCQISYTRMLKAPREYPGHYRDRSVLELRGNPYPTLVPDMSSNRNLIHNVLLDEARKEFRKAKVEEIANKIGEKKVVEETIKLAEPSG